MRKALGYVLGNQNHKREGQEDSQGPDLTRRALGLGLKGSHGQGLSRRAAGASVPTRPQPGPPPG